MFSRLGHQNPGSRSEPIQPKMLDPDPYQINTDPKHCLYLSTEVARLPVVEVAPGREDQRPSRVRVLLVQHSDTQIGETMTIQNKNSNPEKERV